jgi:hypothetical protein
MNNTVQQILERIRALHPSSYLLAARDWTPVWKQAVRGLGVDPIPRANDWDLQCHGEPPASCEHIADAVFQLLRSCDGCKLIESNKWKDLEFGGTITMAGGWRP